MYEPRPAAVHAVERDWIVGFQRAQGTRLRGSFWMTQDKRVDYFTNSTSLELPGGQYCICCFGTETLWWAAPVNSRRRSVPVFIYLYCFSPLFCSFLICRIAEWQGAAHKGTVLWYPSNLDTFSACETSTNTNKKKTLGGDSLTRCNWNQTRHNRMTTV